MRTGNLCEIRSIENGIEVRVMDPEIRKKNQTSKGPWIDPEKEYAFPDMAKALKWIAANYEAWLPKSETDDTAQGQYAAAFKEATQGEK